MLNDCTHSLSNLERLFTTPFLVHLRFIVLLYFSHLFFVAATTAIGAGVSRRVIGIDLGEGDHIQRLYSVS